MFIIVILRYVKELIVNLEIKNDVLTTKINRLLDDVQRGIEAFGIVKNQSGQNIYAYEVDGLGNTNVMDDANIPSLLSIPFIGYQNSNDFVYQNTKKLVLSTKNPYYYSGKYLNGIGSPHTPKNCVWPISIAMEGLVSRDLNTVVKKLNLISQTDNGTNQCHESIYVNDPSQFTRGWFSWANMTYCQLVFHYIDLKITEIGV